MVFLFRSTSTLRTFASYYLFRHSQPEISPICQLTTCITGIKLLHLLVPLLFATFIVPLIWSLQNPDLVHCPWLEEFAWFWHSSWRPSCSTSLVVIYPSHSFYFRVTSYALKGIVTRLTSALPKCPRCTKQFEQTIIYVLCTRDNLQGDYQKRLESPLLRISRMLLLLSTGTRRTVIGSLGVVLSSLLSESSSGILVLTPISSCWSAFGLLEGLFKWRLSTASLKDSSSSKDNFIETRTKIIVGAIPYPNKCYQRN